MFDTIKNRVSIRYLSLKIIEYDFHLHREFRVPVSWKNDVLWESRQLGNLSIEFVCPGI